MSTPLATLRPPKSSLKQYSQDDLDLEFQRGLKLGIGSAIKALKDLGEVQTANTVSLMLLKEGRREEG